MRAFTLVLFLTFCTLLLNFTFLSHSQDVSSSSDDRVLTILLKVVPSTGDSTYSFTVEKTILGKGFLKKGITSTNRLANQEDFLFSFLSASNELAYKTAISNPFQVRYEYADESGALHSVQIPRKEQIIPLRVNYDDSIKTLRIEQKTNNQLRIINEITLDIE